MNKKTLISLIVVIAVVVVGVFFLTRDTNEVIPTLPSEDLTVFDGKNTSFMIEGNEAVLVRGVSEVSVPGSASKATARYFGNEAKGDLNGDGLEDVAFLVTEDTGGSGLFYYVVVALKTEAGYKTTNAFLVGDRIAPQSTEIYSDSKELHVNFAERKVGEPMTTSPSVGAVLLLKVTPEGVLEGLMK